MSIVCISIAVLIVLLVIGYFVLRQMPSYKPIKLTTFDGITYEIFDDHAEVYEVKTDCSKKIKIKDTILGRDVTIIGAYAFDHSQVESVIIPDTVEIIDEYAFGICDSLKHVSFGNSVREIRAYAFAICPILEEIVLPESLEYIGPNVFCLTRAKSIVIPKNVREIEDFAFDDKKHELFFEGDDVNIHHFVYFPECYDDFNTERIFDKIVDIRQTLDYYKTEHMYGVCIICNQLKSLNRSH